MYNGVDLNTLMMIWGELNALMMKCNHQSKEQCVPMKFNKRFSIINNPEILFMILGILRDLMDKRGKPWDR